MTRYMVLIAIGFMLVALFIMLAPQGEKPAQATTQTQQIENAVSTTTPTQPRDKHVTTQREAYTTTPRQDTPTPTTTIPAQAMPTAKKGPLIEVKIHAPQVINTTRLPINITYTIALINSGDEEDHVYINGEQIAVPPNTSKNITKTLTAHTAGIYTLRVDTRNKTYTAGVAVYYYVPKFAALPVSVNVTKLPTTVNVTIKVINSGNWTGEIEGVEVPPGAAANFTKPIEVVAAGRYKVKLGDLEVPIHVTYLAGKCAAEIETPHEVEAVPGETVKYVVKIRNLGNTSTVCVVNKTTLTLGPGEEKTIENTFTVDKAGRYVAAAMVNGTLYKAETQVKIVTVSVWFKMKSPRETIYVPPPHVEVLYSETPEMAVEYTWRVFTNATTRNTTLYIDGTPHTATPNSHIEIPGKKTINKRGEIAIRVNGTEYKTEVIIKPTEPEITQRFTEMQFTSRIKKTVKTEVEGVELSFDITEIRGAVTYGEKVVTKAEVEIRYVGKTIRVTLSAETSGERGEGSGEVTYSEVPLVPPGTAFTFKFRHRDGAITEVEEVYVGGRKAEERHIQALRPLIETLPAVLRPPPTGKARYFAEKLIAMFTKVYYVGEYTWDGYVEVGTEAGPVKVYINPPKTEGPLTVILQ